MALPPTALGFPALRRVVGGGSTLLFWIALASLGVWMPPTIGIAWAILIGIIGAITVYGAWTFSPWVPTPMAEVPRLIRLLRLAPGDRYLELGAGNASLLVAVARASGARCEGVEISPALWAWGRLRLLLAGVDGRMVLGDLRKADLTGVAGVYVWGSVHGLTAELLRTLPTGARLISRQHPIPGIEPETVDQEGPQPLFVYRG